MLNKKEQASKNKDGWTSEEANIRLFMHFRIRVPWQRHHPYTSVSESIAKLRITWGMVKGNRLFLQPNV